MGKLSRLKRLKKDEDERRSSAFLHPLATFKGYVSDKIDGISDDVIAQTAIRLRSDPRYLARWREYSGAEDDQHIDYGNPCVEIEYMACDPSLLGLAARDGERFLAETGCDRETFYAYYDQSAEDP